MKIETFRLPTFASGVYHVWKRNFLHFRRNWAGNFIWIVMEPALLLIAIGYGLGSFIPGMKGVSYVEFFFPSVLCISSMLVSFFETTYGHFSKLNHQKVYSTMIMTPLDPKQIILGEILWASTKGTISAFSVFLIGEFLGFHHAFRVLPVMSIIFVSSFVFASLGMLVTSFIKSHESLIFPTSGLVIPMSLFCGTYFPLDHLSYGLQYAIYVFPLTHTVALVRELLYNPVMGWQPPVHLLVLFVFGGTFLKIAVRRVSRSIVK